jgi:hypothetical protein
MSALAGQPQASAFQVYEMVANSKNFQTKLVNAQSLFEAFPNAKNFKMLDPAVRQIARNSKEGLLTKGGQLLDIFERRAKIIYESDDNFQHKLYIEGNDLRASVVEKNGTQGQKLGKGRSKFALTLNSQWFGERDVVLLDGFQNAPMVCVGWEDLNGGNFLYYFRLLDTNMDSYINFDEIEIGDMVTQIGALRGEGAFERGNVHLGMDNSYILFQTPSTSFGWQMKVTDKAHKRMKHFALRPTDQEWIKDNGRSLVTTNELEMKFKKVTDQHMDMWLAYGKASDMYAGAYLDNVTASPLDSGPGFYEWMKGATIIDYAIESFSIDLLSNIFSRKWYNNVPKEERFVDLGTGELGLEIVRKAFEKTGRKGVVYETEELNYKRDGRGYDGKRNAIIVNRKQITGTFLDPFGEVRFHHLPFLDDDKIEKRKYRGKSIKSAEFLAMDFGMGSAHEANIFIIKDPEELGFTYGVGLWGPNGAMKGANIGRYNQTLQKWNGYEMVRDEKQTMVVKDPACIMWLRPAIK